MRKYAAALLALFLILSSLFSVSAQGREIQLEKISAAVTVPDGLTALVYPVEEGDPNLAGMGMDAAQLNSMFQALGTLVRLQLPDGNGEISVNYVTGSKVEGVDDFFLYEEKEFEEQFALLKAQGLEQPVPIHYQNYRVEDLDYGRFLVLDFTSAEEASNRVVGRQYYTVADGVGVSVVLRAKGVQLEASQQDYLTQVAQSLRPDPSLIGPSGEEEDHLVAQKRTAVLVMGGVLAGVLVLGLLITALLMYRRKNATGISQNEE